MHLYIEGILREFTPIKLFRQQHDLPETFGVALFEPKDFAGLAAVDGAGADLNHLRQKMLMAVPEQLKISELLSALDSLQQQFRTELTAINDKIGLKEVEIDYAVSGFADVNQALLYDLIRHKNSPMQKPDFATIYQAWLNNSVRVSSTLYNMVHNQSLWIIQIVNHAYGRVGLIVHIEDQSTHYIQDGVYACPVEGFMFSLLSDLASKIIAATAH